jgi:hypothetical protein
MRYIRRDVHSRARCKSKRERATAGGVNALGWQRDLNASISLGLSVRDRRTLF